MTPPPDQVEHGVIHDIGFRRYDGPRLGRGYLLRSLYVESLRGAYGLGRSAKSKVMPILLLVVITLPALIIALVAGLTNAGKLPLAYTSYAIDLQHRDLSVRGFAVPGDGLAGPALPGMPLYFSRPLSRSDYVLAKFAAMATALFALMSIPLLVLYVGALLGKLPFWAQTRGVLTGLGGAVIFALVLAGIGLLVASITPKRGFGVAAIIVVLLVLSLVSAILQGLAIDNGNHSLAGYLGVLSPFSLVDGIQVWLFGATTQTKPDHPAPPAAWSSWSSRSP